MIKFAAARSQEKVKKQVNTQKYKEIRVKKYENACIF